MDDIPLEVPVEVQALLQKFSLVFEVPKGLPPRRQYDHSIPLIPRASPVSLRPYRIAPALKSEMESDTSPSYLLFQTLLPLFWTLTCMI